MAKPEHDIVIAPYDGLPATTDVDEPGRIIYAGQVGRVKRNRHRGSTLDSFLEEEGVLPEFQAQAIKEVLSWQLQEEMEAKGMSKSGLARLMKTSRSQIDRVLDPDDGNMTIETLQRAAHAVGRRVDIKLV